MVYRFWALKMIDKITWLLNFLSLEANLIGQPFAEPASRRASIFSSATFNNNNRVFGEGMGPQERPYLTLAQARLCSDLHCCLSQIEASPREVVHLSKVKPHPSNSLFKLTAHRSAIRLL